MGDDDPDAARSGGRDVVVPLRLYKTVVVLSTLVAAGFVVGGFLVLDAATRAGRAAPEEVNGPLAVLGLTLVAAGAAVYAFASRFRAPGMGKAKDDASEAPDDG